MYKKTLIALISILMTTAASAGQWYKSTNEHALYCATPDLAAEVLHADANRIHLLEGGDGLGVSCAELSVNQAFQTGGPGMSDDSPKQIVVPDSKVLGNTFIAGPVVPTSEPHQEIAGCKPTDIGPNGEVDRWFVEQDGTLKLKRFMITSKCINGQMMSHTKRLN